MTTSFAIANPNAILWNTSHFKHGSFVSASLPDGSIISKTFTGDDCCLAVMNDWKFDITRKFSK